MTPDDKADPNRNRPSATPGKPGPILDLKAQRVEPAAGAKAADVKASEAKAPDTKAPEAKGTEAKPSDARAGERTRDTGTAGPAVPNLGAAKAEASKGPLKLDDTRTTPKLVGAAASVPKPAESALPRDPLKTGPTDTAKPSAAPAAGTAKGPAAGASTSATPSASAVSSTAPSTATAGSATSPASATPPKPATASTPPTSGASAASGSAAGTSRAGSPTTTPPSATGPAVKPAATGPGPSAAPTPSASAVAPRPAGRSGALPALLSGLLGVLVGAGLVYGYETYNAGGEGDTDARIAAIEQRLDGLVPRDALAALDRRVGGLDTTLRPLPEAVREARAAADAAGAKAGDALQQAGKATAAPAAPSAPAPASAPAANLGDLPDRVTQFGRQLASLRDEFNAKITAGAEADATLDRRLGALDKALNGRIQANADAEQGLGRRLEEVAKALAERPDAAVLRAGFRAVAANRIALALTTGAPYADAVAALRTLKADDASLAPLARFADTGAPTAGSLARDFTGEAQRIEAADRAARARTAAADGSFTDRLTSMAESLVAVRRTGSTGVTPAAGGTDAVTTALTRGDVPAAAKAWDGLSEAARSETAAFGARLKARAQAEEAARSISEAALAAAPGR